MLLLSQASCVTIRICPTAAISRDLGIKAGAVRRLFWKCIACKPRWETNYGTRSFEQSGITGLSLNSGWGYGKVSARWQRCPRSWLINFKLLKSDIFQFKQNFLWIWNQNCVIWRMKIISGLPSLLITKHWPEALRQVVIKRIGWKHWRTTKKKCCRNCKGMAWCG